MKFFNAVLLTVTLITSSNVLAVAVAKKANVNEEFERQKAFCAGVENGARLIMGARQNYPNVTLGELITSMQEAAVDSDPSIFIMGKMMAIDAYSESSPAFGNKVLQQNAINDFTNKWSAACWSN